MSVLIYGDTERSPALRHELPLAIGDAFLYLETGERRAVLTHALEEARIAQAAPDLERLLEDDLGRDRLIAEGRPRAEVEAELCVRAVAALGIREAIVPPEFPLGLADRLRAAGVTLTPDESMFVERRRRKSPAEMARARIREVCANAGAPAPADIMVKPMGPDAAIGHESGAGPLPAHAPIEIDLWPRDERSGCWSFLTRAFVRGEMSDPIAAIHAQVLDAHERACAAIRPGVTGIALYNLACEVFEAAGHPTQRTKAPGETLREGFYFALGHGVGLEVHEPPILGPGDPRARGRR